MRVFYASVANSPLSGEEKQLFGALAWDSYAWNTGLIRELTPVTNKNVAWHGQFSHGPTNELLHVFIIDSYVRLAADTPWPPICVIATENLAMTNWAKIAHYSQGVIDVSLHEDGGRGILQITTACNWFYGTGTYRYELTAHNIEQLSPPTFAPPRANKPLPRFRLLVPQQWTSLD